MPGPCRFLGAPGSPLRTTSWLLRHVFQPREVETSVVVFQIRFTLSQCNHGLEVLGTDVKYDIKHGVLQ